MKYKIGVVLFWGMLILSACHSNQSKQESHPQDTIPVKLMALTTDSLSEVFTTSGYFTTNNETPLSFKNGGIINKIFVSEGETFKKGQLLATVYGKEINAAAQQATLALKKAKRDYKRATRLYLDSVATLEQKQNAKTALNLAKQRMEAANFNNKHSQIIARHNGIVLEKYMKEGQMVPAGKPVFLVNSESNKGWIFKTGVSDYQWATIQTGDSAKITTDAAPGIKIKGTVQKKSKNVDPKTGSFTLDILINQSQKVHPASGLFGKATLYPSTTNKGWLIPYDALLDGEGHSGYVFVTNDKKKAQKVKVTIAKITSNGVLIKKGLKGEKYIIISGSAYLKDGATIKTTER